MVTAISIIGITLAIAFIVWIVYEAKHAPTMDDWHNECLKARESKADK